MFQVPEAVTLGPLVLSVERLLALVLIMLYLGLAGRNSDDAAGQRAPWLSVIAGLIGARTGFVAMNWAAYEAEPWTTLFVWQGGFSALIGILAALATLMLSIRNVRGLVRPALLLGAASLAWLAYVQLHRAAARAPFPYTSGITDVAGFPVDLGRLEGRPFVVNLWATWCPPCRRETPMLVSAAGENTQVPILLINQGEHPELIRRFLRDENLLGDNVLSDRGAALMRLTNGGGLPTTLFVRADGLIQEVHVGELSRAALAIGIREAEAAGAR